MRDFGEICWPSTTLKLNISQSCNTNINVSVNNKRWTHRVSEPSSPDSVYRRKQQIIPNGHDGVTVSTLLYICFKLKPYLRQQWEMFKEPEGTQSGNVEWAVSNFTPQPPQCISEPRVAETVSAVKLPTPHDNTCVHTYTEHRNRSAHTSKNPLCQQTDSIMEGFGKVNCGVGLQEKLQSSGHTTVWSVIRLFFPQLAHDLVQPSRNKNPP